MKHYFTSYKPLYAELIEKMKDSKIGVYISTCGGGSVAISHLSSLPGRSSVVVGSTFINDMNYFNKFIGVDTWQKYSSLKTAQELAHKSQEFGNFSENHIGIGIACSLATYNERVGRVNVCNISVKGFNFEIQQKVEFVVGEKLGMHFRIDEKTNEKIFVMTSNFENDDRRRIYQEESISFHVSYLLSIALSILNGDFGKNDKVHDVTKIFVVRKVAIQEKSINVYPGSFNPVHDGHKELKKISEELTGSKTFFEISLVNFSKNKIDLEDFSNRLREIKDSVIVSYDKTFRGKYDSIVNDDINYPNIENINFVCGFDTWLRISVEDLEYFKSVGNVKFIVFPRNGLWLCEDDKETYKSILLYNSVVEKYDNDISSSKIRGVG